MEFRIVFGAQILVLTLVCYMAGAAEQGPPYLCRVKGLLPDAPLYYLELMNGSDADKDQELVDALVFDIPDALPLRGELVQVVKSELDVARVKAGIQPVGTPEIRLSAEETLSRQKELERMTIQALDPFQAQRAMDGQARNLPWQYRLNYSYSGLYTGNITLSDVNHDGIMDFLYRENPVLQLTAYRIFVDCGDKYYTPAGMFIAHYANGREDVAARPGETPVLLGTSSWSLPPICLMKETPVTMICCCAGRAGSQALTRRWACTVNGWWSRYPEGNDGHGALRNRVKRPGTAIFTGGLHCSLVREDGSPNRVVSTPFGLRKIFAAIKLVAGERFELSCAQHGAF